MQMYLIMRDLTIVALCSNEATARKINYALGHLSDEDFPTPTINIDFAPWSYLPVSSPFADLETMVKAAHVNKASEDIAGFEYLGSGAKPPPGLTEPVSDMVRTGSGPSWAAPIVDTLDSNSTFQASVASAVLAEFRDSHDASKIGSALDGMLKALNKIIIPIIKQHEENAFNNGKASMAPYVSSVEATAGAIEREKIANKLHAERHGIHTPDDIIAALIEQNEDLKKTVQPLLGAINHALRLWYTWRNKPHHTIMEVVALDGAMNNLAELKTKTPETLG